MLNKEFFLITLFKRMEKFKELKKCVLARIVREKESLWQTTKIDTIVESVMLLNLKNKKKKSNQLLKKNDLLILH